MARNPVCCIDGCDRLGLVLPPTGGFYCLTHLEEIPGGTEAACDEDRRRWYPHPDIPEGFAPP